MSILADPIRVCLAHDLSLAFGELPVTGAALTLDAAIDRHTFETIAAGTRLGWIAPGAPWPLRALDERGADLDGSLRRRLGRPAHAHRRGPHHDDDGRRRGAE
jgi:hypothetical protein